jgi:hypothetical protein
LSIIAGNFKYEELESELKVYSISLSNFIY